MTNQCENLKQYCNSVRNEVFRHLTSIENIGGSTVQQIITAFLTVISLIVAIIGTVGTYRAILPEGVDAHIAIGVFFTILIAWIFFLVFVYYLLNKLYQKRVQKAVELVDNIIKFRKEAFKEYVEKLSDCCSRLYYNECREDINMITVCSDLEKLRKLANELERRISR